MFRGMRIVASLTVVLFLAPGILYADSKEALHDGMRKLWEDHVTWTRLFIVSAAAGLPDKDATTARLLQNQTDIGDAVAGDEGTIHTRSGSSKAVRAELRAPKSLASTS